MPFSFHQSPHRLFPASSAVQVTITHLVRSKVLFNIVCLIVIGAKASRRGFHCWPQDARSWLGAGTVAACPEALSVFSPNRVSCVTSSWRCSPGSEINHPRDPVPSETERLGCRCPFLATFGIHSATDCFENRVVLLDCLCSCRVVGSGTSRLQLEWNINVSNYASTNADSLPIAVRWLLRPTQTSILPIFGPFDSSFVSLFGGSLDLPFLRDLPPFHLVLQARFVRFEASLKSLLSSISIPNASSVAVGLSAMLTFRRAVIVAATILTLFFLFRNTGDRNEQRYHNADMLPKPQPVVPLKFDFSDDSANERATASNAQPVQLGSARLHRKPHNQISLQDLSARPLRDRLAYYFPYDPESKFPAYIWQTWKYAPSSSKFDPIFRGWEASWSHLHPTFVHEVITDSVAIQLIKHLYSATPEVIDAYLALPFVVLKADFFRYLILLARGGIYSDIDTEALQSATEWVPPEVSRSSYGLVIGIEADPDRDDWEAWYSRRIQLCQWTIQSKPGHPILRDLVANITEETLKRKKEGTLPKDHEAVVEYTGPAIWTDFIFKFFNDPEYFDMSTSQGNITWRQFTGITTAKKVGDVIVLPITSFSPGVRTMGAQDEDDPMAFVKHHFEGK